jgi:hypothetical protein
MLVAGAVEIDGGKPRRAGLVSLRPRRVEQVIAG